MKAFTMLALSALAAASLAGCGGKTFCEKQKDAFDGALVKVADCPTMKLAMETARPSLATCETYYAKCSDADKTILDDTVACLEALPACTAATELTSWAASALACQNKANSLSAACVDISKP
jgi:hypothetical protein